MPETPATSSTATDAFVPIMCPIDGGTFLMGDAGGRGDERPVHEVTVEPFQIAECPVSVRAYNAFLSATQHVAPREWRTPPFDDPNLPVCGVNWFDAVAFADWLSRETGRPFHLPTEAQREFAARGGLKQQPYPWGEHAPTQTGVYARGLSGEAVGGPMPLKCEQSIGPNGFGLWHMGDNVHEWCADFYDRNYYASSPRLEPRGPDAGDRRAARGGSWRHDIKYCRSAARSSLAPDKRFTDFGFRVTISDGFQYVS